MALLLVEIISLLILQSQVGRYAGYWRQRATESSGSSELVYVALGDSVAQGIGATSPAKGYVGLLADALQQKTGRRVKVMNLSRTGAKVADALNDQLPQLNNLQPDVVTLGIGSNDVIGDWDEADFRRDMKLLLADLPEKTVIGDLPYFGTTRKKSLEPRVLAANTIIRELAEERGLKVAPLYQITASDKSILTLSADLLHPSNRSHHNWYDAYWRVLEQRISEGSL